MIRLNDLVSLDNGRMPEILEHFELFFNFVHPSLLFYLIFIENFDGDFLASQHMSGLFNEAVLTLSQGLAQNVAFKLLSLWFKGSSIILYLKITC